MFQSALRPLCAHVRAYADRIFVAREGAAHRARPGLARWSTIWMMLRLIWIVSRLLAAATVGVCLGAIIAISVTVVAANWLNGHVAEIQTWHKGVYYAVFLGCVVWSFRRGAAAASVELLWLAALSTAAIPFTTLMSWAIPALGMRGSASMAAVGVDLVAFAGALCFLWIARATARRAEYGPTDSVWAAPRRQFRQPA